MNEMKTARENHTKAYTAWKEIVSLHRDNMEKMYARPFTEEHYASMRVATANLYAAEEGCRAAGIRPYFQGE